MKQILFILTLGIALLHGNNCNIFGMTSGTKALRAPAYPLITIDPYTSAWSFSNQLFDVSVKHWTGKDFPLLGVVKIDGDIYRFMGNTESEGKGKKSSDTMIPKETLFNRTATQISANVQPMQTYYQFNCGPVKLELIFTAPLFLDNLELLSRPVNYMTYRLISIDGKKHHVEFYFEASPQWALNTPDQSSVAESFIKSGMLFMRTGSVDQQILKKKGDNVRIDWGYFYMVSTDKGTIHAIGDATKLREGFINSKFGNTPDNKNGKLALVKNLGNIKQETGHILIGYDDMYSIQYFGENLRPYWNRNNDSDIITQILAAEKDYKKLIKRCTDFDTKMIKEAKQAGGEEYAQLCALAYRQAIAAHKLVQAPNGDILFLSKENFSNGSIGTVDVTYPSAPLFLHYNSELVKGLLNHIFYYSESGKWAKPFAAHDVGTYPLANGQTYGGDMPVEESGNMLILTAAIAAVEGNANYALQHWKTLSLWNQYLVKYGLDPDNQLCTDDFAGHFAHNANLSIKAILGIASYGYLAGILNKKEDNVKYTHMAKDMAIKWAEMADDGNHYRLTFDKPETWSQKYNLVWDKLLHLNIFPKEVVEKEIPYYLSKQNQYGLPLDNRKTYTKTDWIIWTATLASDKKTFMKFISPIYQFMNCTPDRIPMSDWVYTDVPKKKGFQARSVVGGYFIKMLEEHLEK